MIVIKSLLLVCVLIVVGAELVKPIDHTVDEEAIRHILGEFISKLGKPVMRAEFHDYFLKDGKMNVAGRTVSKFYVYGKLTFPY